MIIRPRQQLNWELSSLNPTASPVTVPEPSIFSLPSYAGFLSEADLFPESDLLNVGNTRPPQNLRPFQGSELERTYLTYFAAGDLHTYWHGTKVRVEGGTTHPAQLELMRDLFGGHAKPIFGAKLTPTGQHSVRATFDLSPSFDFLLEKPRRIDRLVLREDGLFYSALSGFSDAEGHVGLRESHGRAYAQYSASNRKYHLMRDFARGLVSREHNAGLYALHAKKIQWHMEVTGTHALKLLPHIGFRHREKIRARQIAMVHNGDLWRNAGLIYSAHRQAIKVERSALEEIAARRFDARHDRRRTKNEIFRQKVESTFELFAKGLGVEDVAQRLNFSVRTAYRRKEKFHESKAGSRESSPKSTHP